MTMIVLRLLPLLGLKSRWHRHFSPRPPNPMFFRGGGGVSLDSWTPSLKPLCHRHPTGPHPSGLGWTLVDSRHGEPTRSGFALAQLFVERPPEMGIDLGLAGLEPERQAGPRKPDRQQHPGEGLDDERVGAAHQL